MKKILLITQGFPYGNSERGFLETEYEYLTRKSDVYILAITDIAGLEDSKIKVFHNYRIKTFEFVCQIRRKEVREDIGLARKNTGILKFFKKVKRILSYSANAVHVEKTIEAIVKKHGIDIVYTYWCLPATVAAARLKSQYNIKVVSRFHRFDLYKLEELCDWQPLRKYISEKSDLLVFVCETGKNYYLNEINNCQNKAWVSFLGTKKYERINQNKTDKLKIVSCSNIIPLKRVDMIARTIALASDYINIEWNHIGGPVETYNFLDGKVIYNMYGAVHHDKIESIFKKIKPDIFITLSTSEGIPISVQEAMSMGIPILATDVGGMSEIVIDGYNGFLFPVNVKEEEVVQALIRFNSFTDVERKTYSENSHKLWEEKCNAAKNADEFTEKIINL